MRAEAVPPVDHDDGLGDALQIHGPVECRVAPAHDQHPLAAKHLRIEHPVVEALPHPLLRALERQRAGRKRPDAARDQERPGGILPALGDEHEPRRAVRALAAQPHHLLAQVYRRAELRGLVGQALHQVFRQDFGEARHVEDVFLRIQGRELAADVVQIVDQPAGGPAHPGVERAEKSGRSRADDGDILEVVHGANGNGGGWR